MPETKQIKVTIEKTIVCDYTVEVESGPKMYDEAERKARELANKDGYSDDMTVSDVQVLE